MFYHIAKHSFSNYSKGDIVAKFSEQVINEFTSNGHVEVIEAPDFMFPKVVHQQGVPEKYTDGETIVDIKPLVDDDSWTKVEAKDEVLPVEAIAAHWSKENCPDSAEQPLVNDETWEHHLAVEHSPAIEYVAPVVEHWSKDGEVDVVVDPQDESWTHHPDVAAVTAVEEVIAVPEFWSKEGFEDQLNQPLIIDTTWTFVPTVDYVPGTPAVIEHWVKDGKEAQYSQPMMLDQLFTIIPEIKDCNIVINDSSAQSAYDLAKEESDRIARGGLKIKCCNEVLACIVGYNTDNKLNEQQLQQMMTTFATAHHDLKNDFPELAKKAILAINPDGVIITEGMKNSVLLIFSKYNI